MSAWKRKALELLPSYRKLVEAAESPMALWVELTHEFGRVHEPLEPEEKTIRAFYAYARWCLESPGKAPYLSDAGTAAVCAFYEDLPLMPAVCLHMPRFLSRKEFLDITDFFRYHLNEEQFSKFVKELLEAYDLRTKLAQSEVLKKRRVVARKQSAAR